MSWVFVQVSSLLQTITNYDRLYRVHTVHTRQLKGQEDNMTTACTANQHEISQLFNQKSSSLNLGLQLLKLPQSLKLHQVITNQKVSLTVSQFLKKENFALYLLPGEIRKFLSLITQSVCVMRSFPFRRTINEEFWFSFKCTLMQTNRKLVTTEEASIS